MDHGGMSKEQAESLYMDNLRNARDNERDLDDKVDGLELQLEDLKEKYHDLKLDYERELKRSHKLENRPNKCPVCHAEYGVNYTTISNGRCRG